MSSHIAARSPETIELVGTWRLVRASSWKNGALRDPNELGPRVDGYITYTQAGRMHVIIDRRSAAQLGGRYGMSQIFAYAGRYTRNGAFVTHHLEMCTVIDDIGEAYVRRIELDGEHLVLCTEAVTRGDNTYVSKLEWVLVDQLDPVGATI